MHASVSSLRKSLIILTVTAEPTLRLSLATRSHTTRLASGTSASASTQPPWRYACIVTINLSLQKLFSFASESRPALYSNPPRHLGAVLHEGSEYRAGLGDAAKFNGERRAATKRWVRSLVHECMPGQWCIPGVFIIT